MAKYLKKIVYLHLSTIFEINRINSQLALGISGVSFINSVHDLKY